MTNFSEIIFIGFFELIFAYIINIFTIPKVKRIGLVLNICDYPGNRKMHSKPLVRIGALSIFLAIVIISLFNIFVLNSLFEFNSILLGTIFGGFFFLSGFLDDVFNLSPFLRLIIQFFLSSLLWFNNVRIEGVNFTFLGINQDLTIFPYFFSFIITTFWIVGIINAINWIDGIDGLAAGISLISTIFFLLIGINLRDYEIILISFSFIGAIIGFLKYNKFPASILMGDCGSNLLGFLIAYLGILCCKNPIFKNIDFLNNSSFLYSNLHLPLLILTVPVVDMFSVICKRISSGNSPFFPDKKHFHHFLANNGINQKDSVFIICSISLWFASISILFTNVFIKDYIFLISSIYLIAALRILKKYIKK